jgi:hypothetical protein
MSSWLSASGLTLCVVVFLGFDFVCSCVPRFDFGRDLRVLLPHPIARGGAERAKKGRTRVCTPELSFGGTEGVKSLFHVLRSRTHFRRYRRRQVPFSRFAFPNSFSAVARTSGTFFMFCAPGLVFGGTVNIGSPFHVLHSRTRFRRYRVRQVLF